MDDQIRVIKPPLKVRIKRYAIIAAIICVVLAIITLAVIVGSIILVVFIPVIILLKIFGKKTVVIRRM